VSVIITCSWCSVTSASRRSDISSAYINNLLLCPCRCGQQCRIQKASRRWRLQRNAPFLVCVGSAEGFCSFPHFFKKVYAEIMHFCAKFSLGLKKHASNVTLQRINKSPAVARVSRPYSWCTLATCVHNCPSMMFQTSCCLRPKCKRSYVLIYITSEVPIQVKRPIRPRNTCVANCGQTAAVSDMVTIDSL